MSDWRETECIEGWGHQHGGYYWEVRDGISRPLHVWIYEQAFGPIPEDMECDHLCNHKWCVNFKHIELVAHIENVQRAFAAGLVNQPDSKRDSLRVQMAMNHLDPEFEAKIKASTNLPHHRSAAAERMKRWMQNPEYAEYVRNRRWGKVPKLPASYWRERII